MLKKISSAALALMLVGGGAVLTATAANAAPAPVLAKQIPNEESDANYDGWHNGANPAEGRYVSTPAGLLVRGKAQIIKGEPAVPADLGAYAEGLSAGVVSGEAWLQLFVAYDGGWTTLRKLAGAAGDWTTSKPVTIPGDAPPVTPPPAGDTPPPAGDTPDPSGAPANADAENGAASTPAALAGPGMPDGGADPVTIPANGSAPLADLLRGMPAPSKVGSGFFVDAGQTATVASFSAGGVVTPFALGTAPAATAEVTVIDADIRPDESSYEGWHNGATDPAARFAVTLRGGGLTVSGTAQILNGAAAGIGDNAAFVISGLGMAASGDVWYQLPVTTPDGGFTTLRAKHAPEQDLGAIDWTISRAIGGLEANSSHDLGTIMLALGEHTVIGAGFFVDAGQTATVKSFSANGTRTLFDLRVAGGNEDPEEQGGGQKPGVTTPGGAQPDAATTRPGLAKTGASEPVGLLAAALAAGAVLAGAGLLGARRLRRG